MGDSAMDTETLLSMSLDDLIAAKGKSAKNKTRGNSGGGGGGGKIRSNAREGRRQQSTPYTSSPKIPSHRGSANNRVYVGNLAWEASWKELKDHMKQAGRVVKADVATEPSGRSKVFVSNLAYEVGWQDLKDHMRQAGNVLRVDVFVGNDGRSKGLAIVEFSRPFEARNAIQQLSDTILMGRPINIREERGDAGGNGDLGKGVGGGAGARVYVGNLSWQVAWQDLKDYMRQAGNVKFVDLFQEPGGRSKGCAVVEYETPQEAHTAIRDLNDTDMMGRMMFVREDREEGSAASKSVGPMGAKYPGAEGRQIFVGNLAREVPWQELKDHFKQVGHVQFVEIPEDAQGRSKGHGTVRFASEQGATRAIDELNDSDLGGRRIFVKADSHY